jgi:aminoglycoside 2'-N-acetyltransferase I
VRRVRRIPTGELDLDTVRSFLDEAWSGEPEAFSDEDWEHALGGMHFLLEEGGAILAHASVVERILEADGRRLRTGYVEAVATRPDARRRGHATAVLRAVADHIDGSFELGALSGDPAFYEPRGWVVWRGPTSVRTPSGVVRTPEEDGSVLVRFTPSTPELDLDAALTCDRRPGDPW